MSKSSQQTNKPAVNKSFEIQIDDILQSADLNKLDRLVMLKRAELEKQQEHPRDREAFYATGSA